MNGSEAARQRVQRLAVLLDSSIGIPGTRLRIGLEPIIGLLPVVGDVAGLLLSGWVVLEALRAGAPSSLILRMLLNVALDALVGLVPLLGDLFDFGFKANLRNARLLEGHFSREVQPAPSRWPTVLGLGLVVALAAALALWLGRRLLAGV